MTRRLELFFNIWPFTRNKIGPIAQNIHERVKILPNISKFSQRLLEFPKSGEILPNLDTLFGNIQTTKVA